MNERGFENTETRETDGKISTANTRHPLYHRSSVTVYGVINYNKFHHR